MIQRHRALVIAVGAALLTALLVTGILGAVDVLVTQPRQEATDRAEEARLLALRRETRRAHRAVVVEACETAYDATFQGWASEFARAWVFGDFFAAAKAAANAREAVGRRIGIAALAERHPGRPFDCPPIPHRLRFDPIVPRRLRRFSTGADRTGSPGGGNARSLPPGTTVTPPPPSPRSSTTTTTTIPCRNRHPRRGCHPEHPRRP
jgi:hypothetical protein